MTSDIYGGQKNIEKFKRLVLRGGGNESDAWEVTFFRDILTQSLMVGTSLDLQAYQPAVVFLNGEFYGILNIRERMDDRYLAAHYNCSEEDVAIYGFKYNKDSDGHVILPPAGEDVFRVQMEEGPEEEDKTAPDLPLQTVTRDEDGFCRWSCPVDAETDRKIRQALLTETEKATVILISHRISTLIYADQILVLDKGKLVQAGTHPELMEQGGLYRKTFELQNAGADVPESGPGMENPL